MAAAGIAGSAICFHLQALGPASLGFSPVAAMPTDYRCTDCDLGLQVGWYHFHGPCESHWAATLGFCRRCGTVHRLLHSSTEGPDQLVSQSAPRTATNSDLPGMEFRVPLEEWENAGAIDRCAHCGTAGQICFDETATLEICPRCGSKGVTRGCSWLT